MCEEILKKCYEELKCTICEEIFTVPMILNCGHAFCHSCIAKWEKNCQEYSCPNCREIIFLQVRSEQIENLITTIYQNGQNKKSSGDMLKKCNEELKCTICEEIFIVPMTLNCGHVFCQYCIAKWEKNCQNRQEYSCPNCRERVYSQIRSVQMENLITAIYQVRLFERG